MTVRSFNGTSDSITCATGAASGYTWGTVAAIVRVNANSTFQGIVHLVDSGAAFISAPLLINNSNQPAYNNGSIDSAAAITLSNATWYLIVARKANGLAQTPRFSVYNYTSQTWTHAAGGSAEDNALSTPGAGGTIRFGDSVTTDWFASYVAARAVWSLSLPWTADSSGDTAIQNAGLHLAAYNWLSNNPSAFWLFNQPSTSINVDDLSSNGTADQTAISGTTVITGSDPPGFDFSLSALNTVQAAQPFPSFTTPFIEPNAVPYQLLGSREPITFITLTDSGTAADSLSVVVVDENQAPPQPFPAFRTPFREPNAVPFQLLGDTSGSASVSLTDAGTATDSITVDIGSDPNQAGPQAAWMFLEPNAASFQLLGDTTPATQISLTDTGAGADALTVAADVPLTDTGAGSDAVTVSAAVPLDDAGASSDSIGIAADVPLTDAGTGTDSISVNTGTDPYQACPSNFPVFTAPFIEPQAIPFQLLGDRSGVTQISLTDAGAGADSLTIAADLALTDTGAGADTVTIAAAIPLTDVGVRADTVGLTATVPLADTAAGDDQFAVQILTVTDPNQAALQRFGWGLLRPDGHIPLQMLGDAAAAAALVNATSTVTITAGQTSAATVTGATTSAAAVTAGATSTPSVSDG